MVYSNSDDLDLRLPDGLVELPKEILRRAGKRRAAQGLRGLICRR
jgi:hypothetical protein